MSSAGFHLFREIVFNDVSLRAKLDAITDVPAFVSLVVQLAAERDCHLTAEEVHQSLQAARRSWLERGIG